MERAPETSSKGMSQGWALAIVAGVLVAVGLTWYLTGSSAEPTPTETPTPPDFSLTDEEAIARFKELDRLRTNAYETRDLSLIDTFLTDQSPIRDRIVQEISRLRRDRTRPDITADEIEIRVVGNAPSAIDINQVVIWDVAFFRNGREVTQGGGRERQVIRWELRHDDEWLLHRATVTKAEPIRK